MEAKWQAAESECVKLRAEKDKLDEDLQFMSTTFNDLEAACFKKDEVISQLRRSNGEPVGNDLKTTAATDLVQTKEFVDRLQATIRQLRTEVASLKDAEGVSENHATSHGAEGDPCAGEGQHTVTEAAQIEALTAELHARDTAAAKQQQAYALLLAEHRVLLECLGQSQT